MPDWDADSLRLRSNLIATLREVARSAKSREIPTLNAPRQWHGMMMAGLTVPAISYVGSFRGEPGLERVGVKIGPYKGVPANQVADQLRRFEATVQLAVAELDALIPSGDEPNAAQLAAILEVCAWAHAEWVRIHPFVNGNGRIARLWVNWIAMRYQLPPFLRLRPRPNRGYEDAAASAMRGNWQPTATVLRRLLRDFLDSA
ncbi:MAG TPA: Fic family protein [Candidatus Binatia bacterium]|nr:Fic family protein [Candidatus Binatia bacterium]